MVKYKDIPGNIVEDYTVGPIRIRIVEANFIKYYVVVPLNLSDEDKIILKETLDSLAYILSPDELLDKEKLTKYLKEQGLNEKIIYLVNSKINGYDWIDPLMNDEKLEDIHCFSPNTPLRVVHQKYGLIKTNIVPEEKDLDKMTRLLAYRGGKTISLFKPVEDTVILPTGDRAALTYKSEVSFSSSFTIRKFPRDPWTITKMIVNGMISPEAAALIWLTLDFKVPIIVYGEMRTGKTSLMNALMSLINPSMSIALVQDAPEMRSFHENILYLYTSNRIGFKELAKLALRKSVDYLIVNEIRVREEAVWWSQLVGTGHGGLTSIHADSILRVFGRLRDMGVEESLADAVKIAIHTKLFIAERNNNIKVRIRRVQEILFIDELEGYKPIFQKIFQYNRIRDVHEINNLKKVLLWLEDIAGIHLDEEYNMRKKFLEMASALGILNSKGIWRLHIQFRNNPEDTLRKLETALTKFKPVKVEKVIIADEIKYCPRCGFELPPNTNICPRCNFKIKVIKNEE